MTTDTSMKKDGKLAELAFGNAMTKSIIGQYSKNTMIADFGAEFIKRALVRLGVNAIQDGNLGSVLDQDYVDIGITSAAIVATKDLLKLNLGKDYAMWQPYVNFLVSLMSRTAGVIVIRIFLNTIKLFGEGKDTTWTNVLIENFIIESITMIYNFAKANLYVPSNGLA